MKEAPEFQQLFEPRQIQGMREGGDSMHVAQIKRQ